MRLTEQQLAEILTRKGVRGSAASIDVAVPAFKLPANKPGAFALGRLPLGTMNKTEDAYDRHLWEQRHTGSILWHKFEGMKLRLADNTFYTCDFAVLPASGVLEMHEIKGRMMDDANVKIKVAASIYPLRFKIVRKVKAGWDIHEVSR